MALYSADQIVGKTLIAKVQIPIKRNALDDAPTVFTVNPGQAVGTVYSWLNVGPGRSTLYWAFYDEFKRPYYAPHRVGFYDISSLQQQGTLTVKQEAEAQAKKDETLSDILQKNFRLLLIVGAVAVVAKTVLPELIKGRK